MSRRRNNRLRARVYGILTIVFALAFLICAGIVIKDRFLQKKAQDNFDNLATSTADKDVAKTDESEITDDLENEANSEEEEVSTGDNYLVVVPERNFDWDHIIDTCKDIYAWIYIPGTNVDYPILQSGEDKPENYYLDHNLNGSKGYPGCIYTQRLNSKDFSDHNTVIYGHNMKNGSMFNTLHQYKKDDYFEENRYAFIYMPDGTVYVYDLFAAYTFNDKLILNAYDCETEDGFQEYLDKVYNKDINGKLRDGVEVTGADKIITLSTCISGSPKRRYLVAGVLVETHK